MYNQKVELLSQVFIFYKLILADPINFF